ncbi:MAG: glycosyltransferase [Planctomycetota bacterium]
MSEDGGRFSVVIPARNEAGRIGACLDALLACDPAPDRHEVVVVVNGSTDATGELARARGVRVIETDLATISAARNLGARMTKGEILLFLDADELVPPDLFARAARRFRDGLEGALGFTDIAPEEAGWVGRTWGLGLSLRRPGVQPVDFLPTRNFFVLRRIFDALQGFDEALPTSEDKDFTLRLVEAGFRAVASPETICVHLGYERSLGEFLRKEFWRQGNTLAFARKRGYSLTHLRHPLLSLWHILLPLGALGAAFFDPRAAAAALLLWILPSAVIALRAAGPSRILPAFWLLTFLRWNASGAALLHQVARGELRRRRPPAPPLQPREQSGKVTYSVVIPAKDSRAWIGRCLASLLASRPSLDRQEIVVVDNGSTDKTAEIARGLGVRVVESKTTGIGGSRNLGARLTKGEIILFLDSDVLVPPEAFRQAEPYFGDPRVGMLGFVGAVPEDAGWVGRTWGETASRRRTRVRAVDHLPSYNLFATRSAFETLGGFDEALATCEDKDFTLRAFLAGYKLLSVADSTFVHMGYEENLAVFARKEFWRQGHTLALARKHGFSLRTMRNPLLSLGHLLLPLGALGAAAFDARAALALALLWLFPSLSIALRAAGLSRSLPALWLVTFLRWNVAGAALLRQIARGDLFR